VHAAAIPRYFAALTRRRGHAERKSPAMNRDRAEARFEGGGGQASGGGAGQQPASRQAIPSRENSVSIFVCTFGGQRRGETALLKLRTGAAYKSIYVAKTNKAARSAARNERK